MFLLTLYATCGIMIGFIVGHEYGWEKRSLMIHGKTLDFKIFIRRLMFG